MNVLFASSEAFPLIKTGGLGDVSNTLPKALFAGGVDVRLVLPAYPAVLEAVDDWHRIAAFEVHPGWSASILECRHESFGFPLWLVDVPGLLDRSGNPYVNADGTTWADNDERFHVFARAVEFLALDTAASSWRTDVVHCNDWQTGLVPAMLSMHPDRPASVFTIHNVSYDCLFDYGTFLRLGLPAEWWSIDGGEFYDRFSMLKSGIVYADAVTTVSEGYAAEICTPEFGYGYAGILDAHRSKLTGILNGVDTDIWSPAHDALLVRKYEAGPNVQSAKRDNLRALLELIGAPEAFLRRDTLVIGYIGRLVQQKGIDLLLDIIPEVLRRGDVRFVLAGTGEADFESRLRALASEWPDSVAVFVGYSERVAHLLEAGCDLFSMPSRFEPCGLNQMYSMLYGTPPVVRRTGGLADTVIDASPTTLSDGSATGFVFDEPSAAALGDTLNRALDVMSDEQNRSRLRASGMARNFGWDESAAKYRKLYSNCLGALGHRPGDATPLTGAIDG